MTFQENFEQLKALLMKTNPANVEESFAFQFNITGEGSGEFYVTLHDGKLSVEPFEYYDRDAMFIASMDVYMKLVSKKMDPVLAYTLGKVKIEGSLDKALLLGKLLKK